MSSAFVDAGQPASGGYRGAERGEDGAGSCPIQHRCLNGAAHWARESEDLEGVTVRSMAFDRFGAVVSAASRISSNRQRANVT
jgi:hypothetical protein